MSSFTKKRSLRGVVLRLTMLVALLMATAPGGLVVAPQKAQAVEPDIWGYVTDGQDPIQGATVWLDEPRDGDGPPLQSFQTTTDVNGRYEFFGVEARDSELRFEIQVYAAGHANGFTGRFAFDGAQVPKDVVLDAGPHAITGNVYDAETLDPIGDQVLFLHFMDDAEEPAWRIPVNASGDYSVYAVPDPSYNLLLDMWVQGYYHESIWVDYEGTLVTENIPMTPVVPYFEVVPEWDVITGHDWVPGAHLDITIDHGGSSPTTFTAEVQEWGFFGLWDLEGFDVQPGHIVTVEDAVAGVTKVHTVTELGDVAAGADSDTVSGYAKPGSEVVVEPDEWEAPSRLVVADGTTGEWIVDFSVEGPNPGEDVYDIQLDEEGRALQRDDDLDATVIVWQAEADPAKPLPSIIKGNDRYLTAIAGSKAAYPDGADAVVIATGEHFADALGGAGLAGALDSPLLLVQQNALPSAVAAEIRNLGATEAYILGGTSAVSNAVADAVKVNLVGAKRVERIAGSNRYQTADRVAAKTIDILNASGGYSGDAFIATGANFPDALGASPVAAAKGMPVFLADPARTTVPLPSSVTSVWITGGTAVVSPAVETSLKASGRTVNRFAGRDRFDTAARVAAFGVSRGMAWEGVGITTGMNFPDALAAGPVLGSRDAVMLLTDTNAVPQYTRSALDARKAQISRVTFFGGDAAVPLTVRQTVLNLIK